MQIYLFKPYITNLIGSFGQIASKPSELLGNVNTGIINNPQILTSTVLTFREGFTVLLISLIYGIYLRYLYCKYSITFSSKISFGNTLILVLISVASLVAVVKSSLALSLGLVGALSVIRFRTAVKEPYNLSFILFAICIAISNGASQYLFSFLIAIFGTVSIYLTFRSSIKKAKGSKLSTDNIDTIYINLPIDSSLDKFKELVSDSTKYFSIISIDQKDGAPITLVINIKVENYDEIIKLKNNLFKDFPGANFKFYSSPNS